MDSGQPPAAIWCQEPNSVPATSDNMIRGIGSPKVRLIGGLEIANGRFVAADSMRAMARTRSYTRHRRAVDVSLRTLAMPNRLAVPADRWAARRFSFEWRSN